MASPMVYYLTEHLQDNLIRLDVEISDFIAYMDRTSEEEIARQDVIRRLSREIVKALGDMEVNFGTNIRVEVYGSEGTRLALPLSDIDLMIVTPDLMTLLPNPLNPYEAKIRKEMFLQQLKDRLVFSSAVSHTTFRPATIPLLKLEDAHTSLEVDVSFAEEYADAALAQIKAWKTEHGIELEILVKLLKHALSMRSELTRE